MMMRTISRIGLLTALLLIAVVGSASATDGTSCATCHGDADLFDEEDLTIVHDFAADVHATAGLSCHDCHGGNPDPTIADDMDAAMDPGFVSNPYRGVPEPQDVPAFCGRCHSDAAYMKRFRPDYRIDQEAEYRSSHHGVALAAGDENVATCISCHGVHGIVPVKDTTSPVYPTQVAETCGRCHGDAELMADYTADDGSAMPVDQLARWSMSVHGAALARGDISAPTCNDCHGNHGSAPPGLESVALVCGQCHGREAELFRASTKREGFVEHNELLVDSENGCRDCHEPPEPAAGVNLRHFTECATCHGNHAVLRPNITMLGSVPDSPCAFCHEGNFASAEGDIESPESRERYRDELSALTREAETRGLTGDARFDWLVDQALALSPHTVVGGGAGSAAQLRPEFATLFQKFRIGKTRHEFVDPRSGETSSVRVVQCTDCHADADLAPDEPIGHDTALAFLHGQHELISLTAQAERVLLSARRGGVEVGEGVLELDRAIGSQVELEAIVHSFDSDTAAAFAKKQAEGLDHVRSALHVGREGLHELGTRRRGLVVALGFIVIILVGLGLKIRWMEA